MTWEEITEQLSELADQLEMKVNINRAGGLETVMLHLVPVAWFCSIKFTGELNIGIYEGEENRLVGKEHLPLAELTHEFVRERVQEAAREQIIRTLDLPSVKEILGLTPKPPLRDVEGVSESVQ